MTEEKRLRMASLLMKGLSVDKLSELTTLLLEERYEWHQQQLKILNIPVVNVSLPHNNEIQEAALKYDRRDRSNEPEGADNDDYIGFKAGVEWMLGYMAGNAR